MVIQKLETACETGHVWVYRSKGASLVRVARVLDTCWYSLKDIMKLLGVSGQTSTIASYILGENKRLFSFGSRPTFVVDLNGIYEMTTMFEINDWSLITELVETVASYLRTRQEIVSMELDKEMCVPKVTQEDMLALDVLNAETNEDRIFALAIYKDFLTK
ncbi:hypothetical protein OB976_05800 [Bacillus cereus]|nr:hypothetical protein [Bacillus cereus]